MIHVNTSPRLVKRDLLERVFSHRIPGLEKIRHNQNAIGKKLAI